MKTNVDFYHIPINSCYNEKRFQSKVVGKIKIHILCSKTFLFKSCLL